MGNWLGEERQLYSEIICEYKLDDKVSFLNGLMIFHNT